MVSKLCRFVDNKHIGISEAFFDKEDDQDSPAPQLTEEEINKLCQALEHSDSEWLWNEVKEIHANEAETEDSKAILYEVIVTLFFIALENFGFVNNWPEEFQRHNAHTCTHVK